MNRRFLVVLASLGVVSVAWFLTRRSEYVIDVPADAATKLRDLRRQPKFMPEAMSLYSGVHDPLQRATAEAVINTVIDKVAGLLAGQPTNRAVLDIFAQGLAQITLIDTEDRERAALYLEQVMDCIGLESSEGLLNRWIYGFDPT